MAKKTITVDVDVDDVMAEVGIFDALDAFTITEIVEEIGIGPLLNEISQDDVVEHFGLTLQE